MLGAGAWLWRSTKQGQKLLTLSLVMVGKLPICSPPLLQRRFGELGSWGKKSHWSVPARTVDLCSRAVPAQAPLPPTCPCGFHVVSLLTFKRMACCYLAFCWGSLSKLTSSVGSATSPVGDGLEIWRALASIIHLSGLLQNAQKKMGARGEASFVTDGKEQFCECKHTSWVLHLRNDLENFSSGYFYFECSKTLLAPVIFLEWLGKKFSTKQITNG